MLRVGDTAPDFKLPSHIGQEVTLSQYRGKKNVVLAFYPLDWTPI
jgi:peroxiredoxin